MQIEHSKFFNDSIHGHIELHPLLIKFIDTCQFQRLRDLKQLGTLYYVYPGACHNRFEHCIGTCYLAGKLLKHIQDRQPEVVDDRDILCVQIAALCHDLGHGPFSHVFDSQFIPSIRPGIQWKHEDASCMMLEHLIKENHLEEKFKDYGLNYEEDLIFIKQLINPPEDNSNYQRPKTKRFLYEIVSNKTNGVDVDKWDYFARDTHHLGLNNSFDYNRVMINMKVIFSDGISHLAGRDKDAIYLYEMFHTRSRLHQIAYQHKINHSINTMICDAFTLANSHITITGTNDKLLSISEAISDPVAFTKLSDNIFYQIANSESKHKDMIKARSIIQRIFVRDLYKLCAKAKSIKPAGKLCTNTIAEEVIKNSQKNSLKKEDIFVVIVNINYGFKTSNPVDNFLFYSKNFPEKSYKIRSSEVSSILPQHFQVFSKNLILLILIFKFLGYRNSIIL